MFPHSIQLKTEKEEDLFSIRVQVKREGGSVTQEQLGSHFTSNSRRNPTTRQLKMNKFAILLCFSLFALHSSQATETEDGQDIIQRFIRAAAASPKKQECRYDKTVWEECDAKTGVQKRTFKLKPGQTPSADCEAEKTQTRTCKKACRYAKGAWTECRDGSRSRKDQLKGPSQGCEVERTVTRKCKSVCKYSKAEWGPCEGNIKSKTLTLMEGTPSECEATKKITKMCQPNNTGNTARTSGGRAKNRTSKPSS